MIGTERPATLVGKDHSLLAFDESNTITKPYSSNHGCSILGSSAAALPQLRLPQGGRLLLEDLS